MNRHQKRKAMVTGAWGDWQRGTMPVVTDAEIQAHADHTGYSFEDAQRIVDAMHADETIWINTLYQVNVRDCGGDPHMVHLSIKRRDKQTIHDWRHLQRIKNELVGAECEAVEIYPADSRLVDTANQYHLWVFTNPAYRIPFGFTTRLVTGTSAAGAVQRPFD